MTETQARERLIAAVERIADALEAANRSDPLLAIQAALEAEKTDQPDQSDLNADMPPHIRRLIDGLT